MKEENRFLDTSASNGIIFKIIKRRCRLSMIILVRARFETEDEKLHCTIEVNPPKDIEYPLGMVRKEFHITECGWGHQRDDLIKKVKLRAEKKYPFIKIAVREWEDEKKAVEKQEAKKKARAQHGLA